MGADLGFVSMDDDVIAVALDVARYPGALSPEEFCAGQGDLVAFILPVPKVSPGTPPVDPSLPDPGVQPGFGGPEVGTGVGGGFSMQPGGKGRPQDEAASPDPTEEVELDLSIPADDAPIAGPEADEPAPSPSREASPVPTAIGGSGGCAAAPGGPAPVGVLGLLALAFLAARRRGVAR
ncbi:MAG: MYXO-CTERM sorting domain-containing protein [bacterium]